MVNWILVPVRNGLHLTQAAIKTMLKQDIGEVRVMLIDNSSTDGTREWARSMHPFVVTIYKNPPLSVAASWNKGLSILFDNGCDKVLVCNNDLELRPDTYRLLSEDGGGFVTAVGVGSHEQADHVDADPANKRFHPHFSCYLIRKKVWEKVGRFDEKFEGAFCEDWDYHCRMHAAGIDAYCIGVPFYHVGSSTLKALPKDEAEWVEQQAGRNREYFKQKWGFEGASEEYYGFFK